MDITSYKRGYNYGIDISVGGLENVEEVLGDLKRKAPAAVKVAINATARQARKSMIAKARARYALSAKGRRNINELKITGRATNTDLNAKLNIKSFRDDIAYFDVYPRKVNTGYTAFHKSPQYYRGRALKMNGRRDLSGDSKYSKAFLLTFESGHTGMVQRVYGTSSDHTKTRSGKPRWTNKQGKVETLKTYAATSAAAGHHTIWPQVEPELSDHYYDRLNLQIQKIIQREADRQALKR